MLATVASERNNTLLLIPALKALKICYHLQRIYVSWATVNKLETERMQTKQDVQLCGFLFEGLRFCASAKSFQSNQSVTTTG